MCTAKQPLERQVLGYAERLVMQSGHSRYRQQGALLMKPIKRWAVILMVQFLVVPVAEAGDATIAQSALDFQVARFKAMVDVDLESLESFLADDLTYTHTTGWVETKSELMSTVESGRIDYVTVAPRDVKVRIYGDIAVMTGVSRMQGAVDDRAVSFTIRFTDVSRRVGNSWQLVAWQSARLPDD